MEDNIKTDVQEIRGDGTDWIHVAQKRIQRAGLLWTL